MHLTAKQKDAIFKKYGGDSKNTGSTEGQIALFTNRISYLTNHLKIIEKIKTHSVRYNFLSVREEVFLIT